MEKLFTYKEAMEALRCSLTTLRRRIEDGTIANTRIGGKNFITETELKKAIKRSTTRATGAA